MEGANIGRSVLGVLDASNYLKVQEAGRQKNANDDFRVS
jgi:hypothetical protein